LAKACPWKRVEKMVENMGQNVSLKTCRRKRVVKMVEIPYAPPTLNLCKSTLKLNTI
jgi:hypothetical protein